MKDETQECALCVGPHVFFYKLVTGGVFREIMTVERRFIFWELSTFGQGDAQLCRSVRLALPLPVIKPPLSGLIPPFNRISDSKVPLFAKN